MKSGFVMAAGVGSALTGFGADLIIIDDPERDREAADAAAIRESTWTVVHRRRARASIQEARKSSSGRAGMKMNSSAASSIRRRELLDDARATGNRQR